LRKKTNKKSSGVASNKSGGKSEDDKKGLPRWVTWAIVGVVILLIAGPRLLPSSKATNVSYTEFLELVEQGQVTKVEINNLSNVISGKLKDGGEFVATGAVTLSADDEQLLKSKGVDYDYSTPQGNFFTNLIPLLLPFIMIMGFFFWMQRRAMGQAGSIMSIGRSRAKNYNADKPATTFADVAGYDGVKQEIREVIDFLRMPEHFKEIGARVPKGVLLVGPPGTGKTLFARAVAGEAGVGFLSVTGSDFMEMFVGVGASRVRDLFQQARKMGSAIIFVDEIDSIGRKRGAGLGGGHDEREQTLNQLLSEMDGFETTEGVIVMAATNRPDILDPALLRPGRFDRQVMMPLPECEERLAILKVHSKGKRMGADISLETMAKATPGMSGADLANLVNEAALLAVRRGSKVIEHIDFENARDRVIMGARRESLILNAEERRATAYHEGGHAVLATVLPNSDPLHKVTILPRGMALGITWTLPEERHTYSRDYFHDMICKAMGGRVAEMIVFGHLNSGAANDLEQATSIARRMVREWGMSDAVGPMAWSGQQQVFLGEDLMTSGREYSDETARMIDSEIGLILRQQEARARVLIEKNRAGLDLVANSLLEHETIDGATVARLVQEGLGRPHIVEPSPGTTPKTIESTEPTKRD